MKVHLRIDSEPWPQVIKDPSRAASITSVNLDLPVSQAIVDRWTRAEADHARARREIEMARDGKEPTPRPLDDLMGAMSHMLDGVETQIIELRKNLGTARAEATKWHDAWYKQRDVTGESGLHDMERWWATCDALIAILEHAREDHVIAKEVAKLALHDQTLRERLHAAGFHSENWQRLVTEPHQTP